MKNKIILAVLASTFVCAFTGCADTSNYESQIATLESERDMYADKAEDLEKTNRKYKTEVDDYKNIEKEYESYKSAMAEYEGLAEAEAEARKIEAEKIIQESKEAEEKAIQESKEAAEKASIAERESREAEEALGYETGITYDQLARTPDDYKDKKIKFKGKVLQVLENDDYVHIRLAVDSNYDTILYCEYKSNIVTSRILEDDIITIYGTSYGLYSYEATSGATITIPAAIVDKIEMNVSGELGAYNGNESDLTMGQKNALKEAINILNYSEYSYSGMIERLEREEYTHEESVFAADNCGADWNEQAAKMAASCLKYSSYSREGLIARLEREGFTHEQAVYGVEQNGY